MLMQDLISTHGSRDGELASSYTETMPPTQFVLFSTDDDLLRRLVDGGGAGVEGKPRRRGADWIDATGDRRVARCTPDVLVALYDVVDIISQAAPTAQRHTTSGGAVTVPGAFAVFSCGRKRALHQHRDDAMSSTSQQLFDVIIRCGRHATDDVNASCVMCFAAACERDTRSVYIVVKLKVNRDRSKTESYQ